MSGGETGAPASADVVSTANVSLGYFNSNRIASCRADSGFDFSNRVAAVAMRVAEAGVVIQQTLRQAQKDLELYQDKLAQLRLDLEARAATNDPTALAAEVRLNSAAAKTPPP